MKHLHNLIMACALLGAMPQTAHAGDTSECELLLVQVIEQEDGSGEAHVPSYIPAEDFLASLSNKKTGHMTEYLGHKIQAIMCRRNEVLPAHSDYDIISTGIPFILSQDFDISDSDSLTMYWKKDKIEHVYKGYPLSEEAEAILETRLAGFSKRGLNDTARKAAESAAEAKAQAKRVKEQESEIETENEVVVPVEVDNDLEDMVDVEIEPMTEADTDIVEIDIEIKE